MKIPKTILLLFFVFFAVVSFAQKVDSNVELSLERKFLSLPKTPISLSIKGEAIALNEGGHLQGIQYYNSNGNPMVYLSGSSDQIAYLLKGEIQPNHIQKLTTDTLMVNPYRHAGGFQIFNHYLAIGIEDNHLRDKSKILIYDLASAEPWENPIYTIYRAGEKERVTAGAVGIVEFKNEILLAVGNWDAKEIDFYACDARAFYKNQGEFYFKGTFSSVERGNYEWLSYQNVNLFSEKESLYLVGLARDEEGFHVADLFGLQFTEDELSKVTFSITASNASGGSKPLEHTQGKKVELVKIASRNFHCEEGADFKAGAGMFFQEGKLGLLASPYQAEKGSKINLFRSFEEWESLEEVSLPFSSKWELKNSFEAPEARQAAVATEGHYFAIDNSKIGKYERASGKLVTSSTAEGTKHLNSGYLHQGNVLLAHSNYPAARDSSDIRILNPDTMELEIFKDFGESEGSLTWVVERNGYWYCLFAYYRSENHKTYLAKFDPEWNEMQRWLFPGEVLKRIGHMSISGGVVWKDGFLVTSHDDRELHYVKIPESGETLRYVATFPAPFWGQGIAIDPINQDIIGIDRPEKKLLIGRFRE
ncbi:hypothetical protein [Pleomorphovibrio marinus]|uniref:hypothetical protein n=1 Tax=Pleomorphovibrio marinus TaxID=2164132 RepID=UPI000E0C25DD|nr:hypothetical protein [Pleomorphovibrio marinus]